MKKLGLITIGQSPRTDVTPDLDPIFGPDIQLCQAGALDGMTAQEIAAFAPEEGDYVLISRLRDGSSAVFAEKHILSRLQQCIYDLEAQGVELIMFLCTGSFPAFQSHVPLVCPCAVLNGTVPALAGRSRIAVITPKEEQREQCIEKWSSYVQFVEVTWGSPYGDPEELDRAGEHSFYCGVMDLHFIRISYIFLISTFAEDIIWPGGGKMQKAEGVTPWQPGSGRVRMSCLRWNQESAPIWDWRGSCAAVSRKGGSS